MTFINYTDKEINCKVVYYGPAMAGKTTNMQSICNSALAQTKGKGFSSMLDDHNRQLFFDFLPSEMYMVDGFKLRCHLYTVPGTVILNTSRQLVLKGVDGIIFVADSQKERIETNIESLWYLENSLKAQNYNIMKIPYALQLNKRDLPNLSTIDELKRKLTRKDEPVFESVACKGIGVQETFTCVVAQIWQEIYQGRYS